MSSPEALSGATRVATLVNANEMTYLFSHFDGIRVVHASLNNPQFGGAFEVEIVIDFKMRIGALGAFLLYLNSFSFDFLGRHADSYPDNQHEHFYLECDDVSNFWQVSEASEFAKEVDDLASEREFFSFDEDHRFMMAEVAENWKTPNSVRVIGKAIGIDGSYGSEKAFYEFEYEETKSEWQKTVPMTVVLEAYEQRLRTSLNEIASK